ncbi:quinol monooxygenase YgiN [Sphingomonas kyeonggiensis]|uniref:Quinol monooxygenase YgiN n=1 Tax=Sphingomonas kyeonggiensis TaxID=1268553 RepID=A0A7W7NTV2_9SPHN|nr:putative quinol monooxygenase [Sphingomonas kyeonggiensis]MBB4841293.1 quinol monooxygenase YgiN [Sphingomonas kyeonggiensis]
MTGHVKTVAVLTARPGKAEALRALLGGLIEPSRAEPGNLRYDLWCDPAAPGRFVLDELYIDHAAIDAHRSTPHFQHYLAHIADLADRSAWTMDAVDVA